MVRHDVHEDLDAAPVGIADEAGEVLVGAEVWIDPQEVEDPVAVVAGRVPVQVRGVRLHRLVGEDRSHPDRRHAEVIEVRQLATQTLEVAAVVVALLRRQVTVGQDLLLSAVGTAGPRVVAAVVGGVAVVEAVGEREVEDLVDEGVANGLADERRVVHGLGWDHADAGHVGVDVVAEEHDIAGRLDGERDVRAVGRSIEAVVLDPALVDGDLELVVARRQ